MRTRRVSILLAVLILGSVLVPLGWFVLEEGTRFSPSDPAPATPDDAGDRGLGGEWASPGPAPASQRVLQALTGTDHPPGNPLGLLARLQEGNISTPQTPGEALATAGELLGYDPSAYPPVPQSPSLEQALDRYAHALGAGGLTPEERSHLDDLPADLAPALVPMVDALAYATDQHRQALYQLGPDDRAELVRLSMEAVGGAQGGPNLTTADRARLDDLSTRVDLHRLYHAGRVLTEATLETRQALSELDLPNAPNATGSTDRALRDQALALARGPPGADPAEALRYAATTLRERAQAFEELRLDPPPLTEALTLAAATHVPGIPLRTAPDLTERLDVLPQDLQHALATLLMAQALRDRTDPASGAATTLEATADALATFQLWSTRLSLTPPMSHFLTRTDLHERTAGLALAAPGGATHLEGAFRLGGIHAGVPMPGAVALEPTPPVEVALDRWYRAFDVSPPGVRDPGLATALSELPDHVREALATLLWAQAAAADRLPERQLTQEDQHHLETVVPVVQRLVAGAAPSPGDLQALRTFDQLATEPARQALQAAVLLMRATDQAHAALERGAPAQSHDGGQEAPQVPEEPPEGPEGEQTDPPAPPGTGDPQGPFADPARNVWFEDPSRLILVTGDGATTYPDRHHAITIDLGGNDQRPDPAGASTDETPVPFSISVDLDGDDTYDTRAQFSQGAAAKLTTDPGLPVGILADYRGNDRYEAGPFSQGSAYMGGVGLLFDAGGDDAYTINGTSSSLLASFEVGGGQGYGFLGQGDPDQAYAPAIGVLVDVTGHDRYEAANGQGAAIVLGGERLVATAARTAAGLLVEGTGDDDYVCSNVCNGYGRYGTPEGLECEDEGGPCDGGVSDDEHATVGDRPGIQVSLGTFLDIGGRDTYQAEANRNDRIGPLDQTQIEAVNAGDLLASGELRAGLRLNGSLRADLGLTDANRDLVPDMVAATLGYDPEDREEGPLVSTYRALDPAGLIQGEDRDGDGYSDAMEQRLGTDPRDPGSAPVLPPGSEGGADKVLDLRIDLTTGASVTRDGTGEAPMAPVGVIGFTARLGDRTTVFGFDLPIESEVNGTRSDGHSIPLLAVGDTVPTRWTHDYPLVVDLGGADRYENNAGAGFLPFAEAREPPRFSSLVDPLKLPGYLLDLGGEGDAYERRAPGPSQGTGAYGQVGVLVDTGGDDAYTARRVAQAAAIGPRAVGVLVDLDGNDRYTADEAAQAYVAPGCDEANVLTPETECLPPSTCDTGQVVGHATKVCKQRRSKTHATALLLDVAGDDTYRSNGQALLDPHPFSERDEACYDCPERPWPEQRQVGADAGEPTPGGHTENPSQSGLPAPANGPLDPTGDSTTMIDLAGQDTYETYGRSDPETTQGYVRGLGTAGQGHALFLEAQGSDTYRQLPRSGNTSVVVTDKNNHLLVQGLPTTDGGERAVALFVDADDGPENLDEDQDLTPDLAESATGARTVEEDHDNYPGDGSGGLFPVGAGPYVLYLPRLGVIVAGVLNDVHNETASLLVDLGGSDTYNVPVGAGRGDPFAPDGTPVGVGVGLDLFGNDDYNLTVEDPGQPSSSILTGATAGAGLLGVGVHVDTTGNDEYNTTILGRWSSRDPSLGLSHGAGFQGVGVLVTAGEGRFVTNVSTDAPPGAAPPSLGLSQGAGFQGVGLLLALGEGDHNYTARVAPESEPRAASQGFAASGLGMLLDLGGTNRYNASGVAQGAAMPYGLSPPSTNALQSSRGPGIGMLLTGTGPDHYNVTHLGQAAALGLGHVGALVDVGGDDTYRAHPPDGPALPALAQSAALVGGTALLADVSGDDRYWAGPGVGGVSASQGTAWGRQDLIDRRSARLSTLSDCQDTNAIGANLYCDQYLPTQTQAVLTDLAGLDRYELRGTLGQGASFSVLSAGTAPPRVNASRATGVLFDVEGDDTYRAPSLTTGADDYEASASADRPPDLIGGDLDDPAFYGETCRSGPPNIIRSLNGLALNTVGRLLEGLAGQDPTADARDPENFRALEDSCPATDADTVTVGLPFLGAGLFLDGSGADDYRPLPHPGTLSLMEAGACSDQTPCLPPDGAGNNEAWTQPAQLLSGTNSSRPAVGAGIGVDAPFAETALRAAGLLMEATDATPAGMTADLTVRTPDCQDRATLAQPLNGTLCLDVRVDLGSNTGLFEIDRVRILSLDNHSLVPPQVVEVLSGQNATPTNDRDTHYQTPWNTTLPGFIDGNTTVRAEVLLRPQANGTRQVMLLAEQGLRLDNAPYVSVEGPTWHNPADGPINVTIRARGDTANLSGVATHPCPGPDQPPEEVLDGRSGDPFLGVTWTLNWSLAACPGSALVEVPVNLTDGTHTGHAQEQGINVDRVAPQVDLRAPSSVNQSLGATGSFLVEWNTTDPFGETMSVDIHVQAGDETTLWLKDQPANGTARWEGFGDGETLSFSATAVDLAGNVGQGSGPSVDVDMTPPSLSDPRVTPRYVQSGEPVAFRVNVTGERGFQAAVVEIDGLPYSLSRQASGTGMVLAYSGWSQVTRDLAEEQGLNASRPEGYPFRFLVTDRAGNTASTVEEQVFLDDRAPVVRDVALAYPKGTAGGPGDLVRVDVAATDTLALADTAHLDVEAVSSQVTRTLRLDPSTGNYTGLFLLDRVPDPANRTVTVTVQDRAGNTVVLDEPVAIATKAPTVSGIATSHPSPERLRLHWRTDVPSTARIQLTDPSSGQDLRFEVQAPATQHATWLGNLTPHTTYQGTLVPLNAAGGAGGERAFTVTTPSAIKVNVTEPEPGALLGKRASVHWNATVPDGTTLSYTVRATSTDPLAPLQRVLLNADGAPGEPQVRTVDLTSLPDGNYELSVEAASISDRNLTTVTNLTVDQTAPFVRLLWPLPGATVGPGTVTVEAVVVDPLTGVEPGSVLVRIGDRSAAAVQRPDGTYEATLTVPEEGALALSVTASDRVGNTGEDAGPLFVRRDAGVDQALSIRYPDGQRTAKPGDQLQVLHRPGPSATHTEPLVTAHPLTGNQTVAFEPDVQGQRATFQVPTDLAEGLYHLPIRLGVETGSPREVRLQVAVDTHVPVIQRATVADVGRTTAHVELCANEPVRLTATAHTPDVEPVRATGQDFNACHLLHLDGLLPGRDHEVALAVADGAGLDATRTVALKTLPDVTTPGAVEELTTTSGEDRAVTLTWARAVDDLGIDHYEVLRRSGQGQTATVVATTAETRYVDGSLTPGQTYHYTIRAVDLGGNRGPATVEHAVQASAAPTLSDGTVTPAIGGPDTTFTYRVNYTGLYTEETRVTVTIDGTQHVMTLEDQPGDCPTGCTFRYETHLAPERLGDAGHTFTFQANHGGLTDAFPGDARQERGPTVTTQAATDQGTATWALVGLGLATLAAIATGAVLVARRFGGGGN